MPDRLAQGTQVHEGIKEQPWCCRNSNYCIKWKSNTTSKLLKLLKELKDENKSNHRKRGRWLFCSSLPVNKSCWSQGKTKEEALKNIQEAIELYLEPEIDNFVEDENRKIYELVL